MTDLLSQELISVIIPVYNIEDYIEQCIRSVINQSYHNLEIILVDDGSTDQSGKICDKYARIDSRIRVIHKKNGGPTEARRIGLLSACGKYIGFLDADDYIDTEMYQKVYAVAKRYEAEMIHFGYYTDDNKIVQCTSSNIIHYKDIQERENLLSQLFSLYPDSEIGAALWSNMFEREFIIKHYCKVPDSQTYGEDLTIMCHCLTNVNNYVSIPEGFYHYRTRKNSISKVVSEKRLLEYYSLYSLLKGVLLEEGFGDSFNDLLKRRFSLLSIQLLGEWNNFYIPKYRYLNVEELKGKKIILYGAGKVGKDYYHQICKYQDCKIVYWVDKNEFYLEYATIREIREVTVQTYDIVLIAVYKKEIADEIREKLIELGFCAKKILWKKPVGILD